MAARFLTSWPCQDACGTIETDERVEGAPVYRCPGCDSSWIELNERVLHRLKAVGECLFSEGGGVGGCVGVCFKGTHRAILPIS